MLLWWNHFFRSINLRLDNGVTAQCDNLQTVQLMNSEAPKLETELKHIDISQHWVCQVVAENRVKIEWIPTNQMIADGFTKPLSHQKHQASVVDSNTSVLFPII
jgi:hypothetical protein